MDAHSKLKPTLEDYILEMETRPPDSGQVMEKDVWAQLHQKEADLLLAAELGKALLEKNEELKKNQEKLIDDYSAKVEVSGRAGVKRVRETLLGYLYNTMGILMGWIRLKIEESRVLRSALHFK